MILAPSLEDIERTAKSGAERKIARLLRDIDGDPEAVAFWSRALRSHGYKQQSEADFVVLWRGVVIVIEVKGGGVRRHEGVWWSVDRRNDWHRLRTSPMEQARSGMHALRKILHEDGLGWFASEAVVMTPDITSLPADPEWLPTHWLAKDDMSAKGIEQALDTISAGRRPAPPRTKVARLDELRTRLFGEFTRMPVIDAQRGAVIEEQTRATAGQARVLAALARNPRVLVYGGAGTGKSLVLVEAAKQETDRGRSVLVTFRSPALVRFFSPHLDGHDIDVVAFDDLAGSRAYDVVLIDEAQDMMTAKAMDRIDATIAGGRADGRWRMFLDPNNQAHVDGGYDEDVVELIKDEAVEVELDLNVRNTKAIVHMVQQYLAADVGDPGIVHGERVAWRKTAGTATVAEAKVLAKELVTDGADRDNLWIIDVCSTEAPHVDGGFIVTSPRYAKGLEAEHVIVCNLPQQFDDTGTAAFYVAATRARLALHVVVSKDDEKRLQDLVRRETEDR